MKEEELIKSNMSFLEKIKKFCFGVFGATILCGIMVLVNNKLCSYYLGKADEFYETNIFQDNVYWDKLDSAERAMYAFLYIGAVLLIISVVLLIFYFYSSKMSLTVTNKRIYGKTAFGRRVDLPLDMISAVGTSAFKGIAVATSSGKIKFVGISNRDEIHKTISNLLVERQENKNEKQKPATVIQQSDADELGKYKKLLDDGVITQEEFDAKKKQILGL